jgi:outer membrane protein
MRNKLLLAAVIACCACTGLAPDTARAEAKTITELYTLAKAKDPVLGRSAARLEAGKADQEIAWAAVLPRISASASQRRFWHTVINYGPSTTDGSYEGFNYAVGGQVPLFNVPSYLQIAAADAGLKSAEAGTDSAQQDLIVRLVDGYVKLLKAQADEQLYRDELARLGEILKQAEALLKVGAGDIIAVYEAKARMNSAAADLIKAESQNRLAQQILSSLTGITVTAVKDIPVKTASNADPADIDWWVETMRKQNPGIRQAQEDLNQAKHMSNANRAGHLPTIQFSGGYSVDKGSTFLPEVETKQWYIGASVSLPIYSGGETVARTRRAMAGESERRYMLDDSLDQSLRRLKETFLTLQYNVSLVEAYKRKLESMEMQLKATLKGREIGTRTAIDLLNAEQSYAVARRDLTHALYDNIQRNLELRAAAGILSEAGLSTLDSSSSISQETK